MRTLLRRAGLFAMDMSWGQVKTEAGPAPELKIGTPTKLKLDNGLQVIVVENHRMPAVTWSMTLEFPPFLEGEKAGLQDLVSSMMAAGTASKPKPKSRKKSTSSALPSGRMPKDFFASSLSKNIESWPMSSSTPPSHKRNWTR